MTKRIPAPILTWNEPDRTKMFFFHDSYYQADLKSNDDPFHLCS
jgi:hypothetical protein